jgi:hypothetical protein
MRKGNPLIYIKYKSTVENVASALKLFFKETYTRATWCPSDYKIYISKVIGESFKETVHIINHEFMHCILERNNLEQASCDLDIIEKNGRWCVN